MAGHETLATPAEVAQELKDGALGTSLMSDSNPVAKIGATLIQDHDFTASILKMADPGTVGQFLAIEFVLVLALWGFRAKKLAQLETLPKKMLAQAWISGLYWLLAMGVVPGLVWGKAFWTAVGHFMRVALRQILV
jgi:hypothetical protein